MGGDTHDLTAGRRAFERRAFLIGAAGLVLAAARARVPGLGALEELAQAASTPSAGTSLVSRDEHLPAPRQLLGGERILPPRAAPRFNLLGLHWRGSGDIDVRTPNAAGGWSEWFPASGGHLPDENGYEPLPDDGWRVGAPVFTGEATKVQFRLRGEVTELRSHFVWSPIAAPSRQLQAAAPVPIITRSQWGADEEIVRAKPLVADRLTLAVVHHTAGKSPETPEESAAVVRGIQAYHVEANGWNDLGYNFLVDQFGQVFEGRGGGIEANVVGAHALGANTGSVGIAVLGNFEKLAPSEALRQALVSLLAWRLDVAHLDPLGTAVLASGATVRAISGHRDVNSTACPGAKLYPELDWLARDVAATGLPKLYAPTVVGAPGGSVRFRARLSAALSWTVTVTDSSGATVARGGGSGSSVDWTWDASGAASGAYAYSIAADGVRAASGTLAGGSSSRPETPPARPPGVPRRIPRWAWQLLKWQSTPKAERGPRPAGVPRRLPSWYWPWRKWRLELARYRKRKRKSS